MALVRPEDFSQLSCTQAAELLAKAEEQARDVKDPVARDLIVLLLGILRRQAVSYNRRF
jgi:hypothetical protein